MNTNKIETVIGHMLARARRTVAFAESCTGGILSSRMTDVPGCSAYFLGGVVAYSDQAKERLLGVRHETLATHGSASEQTALEMARGVRRVFDADIGVGITGVAGPGGGTPEKPVGLVFIALSACEGEFCELHVWQGNRNSNRHDSGEASFRLIQRFLEESN